MTWPMRLLTLACIPGACHGADPSGITIVVPGSGEVVRPGSVVTVSVEVDPSLDPASVVVFTNDGKGGPVVITDSTAPYGISFTVSNRATGELPIQAAIRRNDAAQTFVQGQKLTVNVIPADPPESLRAALSTVLTFANGAGTTAPILVHGTYADGITRNLTSAAMGTTYQSSDATVATVDAQGKVQAVGLGTATVTITNSGLKAYVVAEVTADPEESAPAADITNSVSISGGGFRREPDTGHYVQQVSIRNTSGVAVPLPLSLMVYGLPQGITLENKVGKTKFIAPVGSVVARVTLPDRAKALPPGAVAHATLKFSNRDGRAITYQSKLIYGIRP